MRFLLNLKRKWPRFLPLEPVGLMKPRFGFLVFLGITALPSVFHVRWFCCVKSAVSLTWFSEVCSDPDQFRVLGERRTGEGAGPRRLHGGGWIQLTDIKLSLLASWSSW